MRLAHLLAAAALAAAPAIATAQTLAPLPKFDSVELNGGGDVTIRQGPIQRVTLRSGSTEYSRLEVRGGKLVIRACGDWHCPRHYDLEVEIETPEIGAAAINGGGYIVAEGAFRPQGAVSAAVRGGGKIDLQAVKASAASAAVHGGGGILLFAQNSLSAEVNGGGSIRYLGQPTVNSSVHGGGSVNPVR
jgi:hypothetical protein